MRCSNHQIVAFSPSLVDEQAALLAPVNECCLCGLVVGPEPLAPGSEQTLTITVNDTVCPNGPFFSMASMLGEYILHTTKVELNTPSIIHHEYSSTYLLECHILVSITDGHEAQLILACPVLVEVLGLALAATIYPEQPWSYHLVSYSLKHLRAIAPTVCF